MTIYVLRSDNLVKIGFTENLNQRVQAIISAVPVPVVFVGYMPGDRSVEKHLHGIFSDHRFSGEWFVETPEMTIVFETLLSPHLPELLKTSRADKRKTSVQEIADFSARLRDSSAVAWPHLTQGKRIAALAQAMGWNKGRTKDLYYADPRVAISAFEMEEFSNWLQQPVFAFRAMARAFDRAGTEG